MLLTSKSDGHAPASLLIESHPMQARVLKGFALKTTKANIFIGVLRIPFFPFVIFFFFFGMWGLSFLTRVSGSPSSLGHLF